MTICLICNRPHAQDQHWCLLDHYGLRAMSETEAYCQCGAIHHLVDGVWSLDSIPADHPAIKTAQELLSLALQGKKGPK